jgi:hypothetical protein
VKRILIEDGLATILTICFMPFSVFRQCRDPDYAAWPLNAADRAGAGFSMRSRAKSNRS